MKVSVSLTRALSKQALKLQKNSPHILFVGGLVGVGVSTVLACRATLKLEKTLDVCKEELEVVRNDTDTSPELNRKDVAVVYTKNAVRVARLYGPPVVIMGVSVATLTGSHVQLTRRNNALMAAYAAVATAYENYRNHVREELGEQKELELYHGVKKGDGTDKKGVLDINSLDPNLRSPYAKWFDEASQQWRKDPELNQIFLRAQQNYFNQLLHTKGYVFLNDVYDALDIERTSAGQIVGWVIGKDGDNYIDFGIFDERNSRFVNGWEARILLDFNVDGVVFDKI